MATFIARSSAQLQHEQIRSHYVRSFDRTSCTQWLMNTHATDDTLCWCYGFSKAASATVNLTPADTTCSAHAVSVRVHLTPTVWVICTRPQGRCCVCEWLTQRSPRWQISTHPKHMRCMHRGLTRLPRNIWTRCHHICCMASQYLSDIGCQVA